MNKLMVITNVNVRKTIIETNQMFVLPNLLVELTKSIIITFAFVL